MAPSLIFGKYEIQHRLAVGGMGEVFFARQTGVPGFERAAILKSLLPDLAQQPGFIDQFLDEARVAATLNHPNVVSIYEVGLWEGTYFIAMEYIRGRNLSQLIRRAQEEEAVVPPVVAAQIIREAALGLDHAHQATDSSGRPVGIVHRDISPQNIMVRDDGVTKVVDFGIARATNRATRTATGLIKGKLAYMAPEQILDKDVGQAVDQFALGVVLWELLVGRRLFKAENELTLSRKVLEDPIPPPSQLAPHVPAALSSVAMRMLERDQKLRYPSCAEVAVALSEATLGLTPSGANPIALFMRRLGTDDLVVKSGPSQANYVISLERASKAAAALPPTATYRGAIAPADAAPPRSRKLLVALVAIGLPLGALTSAGVLWWQAADERPLVTPPAPPSPVAVAPVEKVEPKDPPAAVVEPAVLAHVKFKVVPAGASVRLDGRWVGESPLEFELEPGRPHHLLIARAGFRSHEQELSFAPGEQREVNVKLAPLPRAAAPAPAPTPAPAEPQGPGFLTINTVPWSKVAIDGTPHGSTPLNRVKLEPGPHTVVFVNEGENINKTITVVVRAGVTTKLNEKLK